MKKITLIITCLVLFSFFTPCVFAKTSEADILLAERLLELSEGDKTKFVQTIEFLDEKKINLNDESELKQNFEKTAENLGVDLSEYKVLDKPEISLIITGVIAFVIVLILIVIYFIIYYLKQIKNKKTESGKERKPNLRLKNYIKKSKEIGFTKKQIKQELLKKNWSEKTIDSSLKN